MKKPPSGTDIKRYTSDAKKELNVEDEDNTDYKAGLDKIWKGVQTQLDADRAEEERKKAEREKDDYDEF